MLTSSREGIRARRADRESDSYVFTGNKRCRTCRYRISFSAGENCANIACGYILVAKQSRGCNPGDECTKYVKGKKFYSDEDEMKKRFESYD